MDADIPEMGVTFASRDTARAKTPSLTDRLIRHGFDQAPHAYLLLDTKLVIAGANGAYLAATMTRADEIVGCEMFEVFPDNPNLTECDAETNLSASLARVLETLEADRMPRQRYDIRNPDGDFEERWWEPLNSPVFDDDGRLALILHHVRDVTSQVREAA